MRSLILGSIVVSGFVSLASAATCVTPAEMDAVRKKVDPHSELGEDQRNIASLNAVYQYKLRQGDPQGAQRAAFSLLQNYRLASQRYAVISNAAETGAIDARAKAAMKAYANISDGKDFKIWKESNGNLSYSFADDKTGKTITQGVASPAQFTAAAMLVVTKGFEEFLLQQAGTTVPANDCENVSPRKPASLPEGKKRALNCVTFGIGRDASFTNCD
jgi:type II secretory pathway pseudopilin PulG